MMRDITSLLRIIVSIVFKEKEKEQQNIMRIEDLLLRQSANDKRALVYGSRECTYRQWADASHFIKDRVQNLVGADSKCVALYLPNSIDYAIAYFGLVFAGKVLIPIGSQVKALEIRSTIEYSEVDLIVSLSEFKETLKDALEPYPHKTIVYYMDIDEHEIYGGEECIKKSDELKLDGSADDVVIMLHTSGTTSNPKRVMLTHNNLINNIESNIESLKLTEDDKVLIALPMYFGYCNTAQYLTHVYLGATIVILDSMFFPKNFFAIVQKEKITGFTAVPSMLYMVVEYRHSDKYDFSSLRYVCFGGGKMSVEKLSQIMNKLPNVNFVQTYGQTECSPRVTALLPEDAIRKLGSVGKPIPNVKVAIVDKDDNVLGPNEHGEITVVGKNVMKGYYKNPEATKYTLRNGILHTGDIGYFDDEGYLYVSGRIKNMIIRGGINIYPEEIESFLLKCDGVKDAMVYGVDDDMWGEIPMAKVVLENGTDVEKIKQACEQQLTAYKVPQSFIVVDELSKTYNGKTKRF